MEEGVCGSGARDKGTTAERKTDAGCRKAVHGMDGNPQLEFFHLCLNDWLRVGGRSGVGLG